MIGFNYLGRLGQLGNQMFQYAAVLGTAESVGTTAIIPRHDEVVVDNLGNHLRIELDDAFNISLPDRGFIPALNYQETDFTFNPDLLNYKGDKDISLVGFFQTEKYFKHIEDKVRKEFTFKEDIVEDCKDIIDGFFENPVALHIRRGDYLKNAANHHNLTLEYYEKALEEFAPDRQVVIFTDDPQWVFRQPLFNNDRFIVSESEGPYHDLYMMTQCDDFIIANSTFSWWGAWLANRGKVIVPHVWFGPNNAHKSLEDLYPPQWKVIPYS